MGWGGRGQGGSGWGTQVYPQLIHVNVWQNPLQCRKAISLKLKLKKKKISYNTLKDSDLVDLGWDLGMLGFPGGNPSAYAGDIRDMGSILGSGRSPGEGTCYLLQYSCLENLTERGAGKASAQGTD